MTCITLRIQKVTHLSVTLTITKLHDLKLEVITALPAV